MIDSSDQTFHDFHSLWRALEGAVLHSRTGIGGEKKFRGVHSIWWDVCIAWFIALLLKWKVEVNS